MWPPVTRCLWVRHTVCQRRLADQPGGNRGGGIGGGLSIQINLQPLSGHKNYRLQEGVQIIHKTTNIVRMCYKLCHAVQNYDSVRKQHNLRC